MTTPAGLPAEARLRQVDRAIQALSGAVEALVRATDEQQLLDDVCAIVVGVAGYRMCWVAYAVHDEARSVRVMTAAGERTDYPHRIKVTWADEAHGRGGTGTAIRTGMTSVAQDIASDSTYLPWRDDALECGFASVICLPLRGEAETIGALSIYSSDREAFHSEEVRLLENLAEQLGHGIRALRARTERERANEELRALAGELEARVASRTDMITALNEQLRQRAAELEASNFDLESFAYSVSHDLRAPLRAIDGFSRILKKDCSDRLEGRYLRFLDLICDNAGHMAKLIDDLLRFSRAGRQALHLQTVEPNSVVQACLESLASELEGRIIDLQVARLAPCTADPGLLQQVWFNLVSNAVKFTRPRERAHIEVGCRAQDGETVYFVRDDGVGFDAAHTPTLFGVFQRQHRQEDFEGTGIGLALCARIVKRHGGRIWAEARSGEGAAFFFTLAPP